MKARFRIFHSSSPILTRQILYHMVKQSVTSGIVKISEETAKHLLYCINLYVTKCVCFWEAETEILGAFEKLRKATISFVVSLCPSVRPHETTRLPLDGFALNFVSDYFQKICRESLGFVKIWQERRVLYIKTNIHFWSYLAQLLLEWEMFQTNS
jgi:hypothetical protein